jgi:hypothetical protein
MPQDTAAAVQKLREENEAMEKEIMALTKGSVAAGETKAMGGTENYGGIKVMKFGVNNTTDNAGIDNGSSWCPPQCSGRTVMGGFFTS